MPSALPIAAFYFCSFGALGLSWPWLPLLFAERGLSAAQVTLVLALSPALSILAPPLAGLLADARRARSWILRGTAVAAALVFAGFLLPHLPRAALAGIFFFWALFRAPLVPLADATAVDCARRGRASYGAIRLWGSLGFLIAVLSGGALVEARGTGAAVVAGLAALALAAGCAFALPPPAPAAHAGARTVGDLKQLLGARDLWIFLAAIACAQAGGSCHDGCLALYLQRLGHGPRFVGAAWGIGVAAEIVLLALSQRIVARIGAARLFTLSAATGALRWALLPRIAASAWLLAAQPLHGVTFGLLYASAVAVIAERGRATPSAAQGLMTAAWSAGAIAGIALSGTLLDRFGGGALFGAAAVAAAIGCGLGLAYERASAPAPGRLAPRAVSG